MTSGVTALDRLDADDIEENGFGAPEAPACKYRDFLCHVTLLVAAGAEIGGVSSFGKTP
jgi:hypothetical protein